MNLKVYNDANRGGVWTASETKYISMCFFFLNVKRRSWHGYNISTVYICVYQKIGLGATMSKATSFQYSPVRLEHTHSLIFLCTEEKTYTSYCCQTTTKMHFLRIVLTCFFFFLSLSLHYSVRTIYITRLRLKRIPLSARFMHYSYWSIMGHL
jgi:hypothetical protein